MREQLGDLGTHLPTLWANGTLSPVQQKELLRSLIRRIIITRPVPDTVGAKVVWVSAAITSLAVHPAILRGSEVSNNDDLVERVLALGVEGHQDREIARRLTAEGFRSAQFRSATEPGGRDPASAGLDIADRTVPDAGEAGRAVDDLGSRAGIGRASQLALRPHP